MHAPSPPGVYRAVRPESTSVRAPLVAALAAYSSAARRKFLDRCTRVPRAARPVVRQSRPTALVGSNLHGIVNYRMRIKPAVTRRAIWAVVIAPVLIAMVIGILSFVHVTASIEPSKRCAPSIWQSQWPKWIGCTMAAHEGLAGGLIGGAGALFAAWVAYTAVRDQIDAEGERVREQIDAERRQAREQLAEEERQRLQQHAEAKEVALVVITQPVHAAATALAQIDDALRIGQVGHIQTDADRRVDLAIAHVKGALESFTVRESVRDLAVHDRVLYLLIVSTLSTFVNVTINQSPFLSRGERLQAHRRALMRLHAYLGPFDTQLAQVFARDSATTPNP